jgi:hypothetical protein
LGGRKKIVQLLKRFTLTLGVLVVLVQVVVRVVR